LFWGQGMVSARHTRLEEVGTVGSHLMKVQYDVRLPLLDFGYPAPTFRVLHWQPISVQVKPIVIGPSPRPGFVEFSVVGVTIHMVALMGIDPRGETVDAVRVDGRVQKDHHIFQVIRNLSGSGKMVS